MRHPRSFPSAALLPPLLLMACSHSPRVVPINETNEPVFHTTHYTSAGLGTLATICKNKDWDTELMTFYPIPLWSFDRNVSSWAGFSYLPVFWNLLLSGEQYADSSHLKIGKPAVALHGGLSGLVYSQLNGWEPSGLLSLEGKFLFNESQYLRMLISSTYYHLPHISRRLEAMQVMLGGQLSTLSALRLEFNFTRYRVPKFRTYTGFNRLNYLDGDNNSEVVIAQSTYLTKNHVLRCDLGYGFRNLQPKNQTYLKVGIGYSYVFN